jgi:hypothetical protein
MTLALVVQETFSSLLVVTLNGVRMACHVGCRTTSIYEYSREGIVPFEKGFLHLPVE